MTTDPKQPEAQEAPASEPSFEDVFAWAVEDGVIRLSKVMDVMDPDLQDALVKFARRFASRPPAGGAGATQNSRWRRSNSKQQVAQEAPASELGTADPALVQAMRRTGLRPAEAVEAARGLARLQARAALVKQPTQELPPLPDDAQAYFVTRPCDVGVGMTTETVLSDTPGCEDEESEPLFTADQMRDYARAALGQQSTQEAPSAGWHERRWRDYERDYILPCFKIADEIGFDLKAAVAESRGNCVMRLIEELRRRAASAPARERQIERMQSAIEGECGGLAIDKQQARAILEYVLETAAQEAAASEPLVGSGLDDESSMFTNPMFSDAYKLEYARGAIKFRNDVIANLRSQIAALGKQRTQELPPPDVPNTHAQPGGAFFQGSYSRALVERIVAAQEQPTLNPNAVYLVYYDDFDRRPEIVTSEAAGRALFKRISGQWNAHLFVKVASNTRDEPYARMNWDSHLPAQAAPVRHSTKENGDCPHWCKACAAEDAIEGALVIRVEKMLCEKLGRPWSAAGISIESLINELAAHSTMDEQFLRRIERALCEIDPSAADIAYPRDFFDALISGNSPYAFYIFQWVPYQTEAKRWRLKLQHDVRAFDGREAFNIWPNGRSCGPFRDEEVEFIRISKSQWGVEWKDPRPDRPDLASAGKPP